jgi:hypothetical protein
VHVEAITDAGFVPDGDGAGVMVVTVEHGAAANIAMSVAESCFQGYFVQSCRKLQFSFV